MAASAEADPGSVSHHGAVPLSRSVGHARSDMDKHLGRLGDLGLDCLDDPTRPDPRSRAPHQRSTRGPHGQAVHEGSAGLAPRAVGVAASRPCFALRETADQLEVERRRIGQHFRRAVVGARHLFVSALGWAVFSVSCFANQSRWWRDPSRSIRVVQLGQRSSSQRTPRRWGTRTPHFGQTHCPPRPSSWRRSIPVIGIPPSIPAARPTVPPGASAASPLRLPWCRGSDRCGDNGLAATMSSGGVGPDLGHPSRLVRRSSACACRAWSGSAGRPDGSS